MNTYTTYPIAGLLAAIGEHLSVFEVGEPLDVHVQATPIPGDPAVTVHLNGGRRLPELAGLLLAWADTLTDTSVEAWRTPGGDSVHLAVSGLLADDTTPVRAYGGVPATDLAGLGLEPGQQRRITLGRLRTWADLAGADDLGGGAAA
jgi:hypothetical protein